MRSMYQLCFRIVSVLSISFFYFTRDLADVFLMEN